METVDALSRAGIVQLLRQQEIVTDFHKHYFTHQPPVQWMGVTTLKCPLDLWMYQQILHEVQPDFIIETGTYAGGSALFLAHTLDAMWGPAPMNDVVRGVVYTIDPDPHTALGPRPKHPRIVYRQTSSLDHGTLALLGSIRFGTKVLVILDSDHAKDHVLAEMRAYGPMVSPGSYLIVEDSNVNGHPVNPDYGPGPMEAITAFLAEEPSFYRDLSREAFWLTFNPNGFLRRTP